MTKKSKIPVHRMDEKFSGIYIAPLMADKSSAGSYERSRPHRHDFYYGVLLDQGEIELSVDFEHIKLSGQSLFLSYPGQIHHVISSRTERGWYLAFDPSILDEQLKNILDECLSQVILVPLSSAQCVTFFSYLSQLYSSYQDPLQLFHKRIMESMTVAFVYQLASAYLSMEQVNLVRHSARSIEITKSFRQILRRNFTLMKKPSHYAAQMNITITHLNDTIRAVTGFPVTYHIQQELMREAQRLLYQSSLTVKEIAGTLGFEDAGYFNRLFHKVVGISPGRFRKQSETAISLQDIKDDQ